MSSQFREHGMRILAYMKEQDVAFDATQRGPGTAAAQCMAALGYTPFEFSHGLGYLLRLRLVVIEDLGMVTGRERKLLKRAGMVAAFTIVVNPNPPTAQARPLKEVTRKRLVTRQPARELPAPAEPPAPKETPPPVPAKAAPAAPERPPVDIDSAILDYLNSALAALRGAATGNGEWLALGVIHADLIVRDRVGEITRGQAKRLVTILGTMKLFRTCDVQPGGSGGCSHVHSEPKLVTAAMARKAGHHVEETVDELHATLTEAHRRNAALQAELRQKDTELTELRAAKATPNLGDDLAARVQYLVLKALTSLSRSGTDQET